MTLKKPFDFVKSFGVVYTNVYESNQFLIDMHCRYVLVGVKGPMKDKLLTEDMLFQQLEDVLEERQNSDRRRDVKDELPEGVQKDRRAGDRRSRKKKLN